MFTIDWARFKRNVHPERFHAPARDKSFEEFLEPYRSMLSGIEGTESWGRVMFMPNDEQRDLLLRLTDTELSYQDSISFFQSIEGDMCEAAINLAGRLERGEGLNGGDCQLFLFTLDAETNGIDDIFEDATGDAIYKERIRLIREANHCADLVKGLEAGQTTSNIYTDVLC